LQILSLSSDESTDDEIEPDNSDSEDMESDDSDSENLESDKENQNINIQWNIRGGILGGNFLPNLAISSIYLKHSDKSAHFIWKNI
jgi:hypothetical protein